jgi:hypothetical protein
MFAEVPHLKAQTLTLSTDKLQIVSLLRIFTLQYTLKSIKFTHLQDAELTIQHPLAQPSMHLKLCRIK